MKLNIWSTKFINYFCKSNYFSSLTFITIKCKIQICILYLSNRLILILIDLNQISKQLNLTSIENRHNILFQVVKMFNYDIGDINELITV